MSARPFSPARHLGVLCALLGALLMPVQANANAVDTQIEIDRPLRADGDTAPVYLLVRFRVPQLPADLAKKRPPLNIALVLDRSGSMKAEGKMDYLKRAAIDFIDRLGAGDRLAVVEYDDRVTLAWPSAPVEAPGLIKRIIEQLEPRGSTDLTGGLMMGAGQVSQQMRDGAVNRVLLLSDGLANHGVTHPLAIRRLVRGERDKGVHITTLGLGAQFDEILMTDIAENAGGNYYFIENPDQMAAVFTREVTALASVSAREPVVRLYASGAVKDVKVFGYAAQSKGSETEIRFPDFYAGERRSLVLRLNLAPGGAGLLDLGHLDFSYSGTAGAPPTRTTYPIAIRIGADGPDIQEAANPGAIVEAALVEAEDQHGRSLAMAEQGQWKEAQSSLTDLISRLKTRNQTLADVRIAKKIEALEIETQKARQVSAAPSAQASKLFLKQSRNRLYEAKKGIRSGYMTQAGDQGDNVKRLQKALAAQGFYSGPIDGNFTPGVERAVKDKQTRAGLAVDGIAGPATLRALDLY